MLEVVEQNELLLRRVSALERQLSEARTQLEAKDEAIIELAALVDKQMGGALQEGLNSI